MCVSFTPLHMTDSQLLTSCNILNVVLQDHTKVGSADSQDIQLCGMGIQAEHCVIDITADAAVILSPYRNAR